MMRLCNLNTFIQRPVHIRTLCCFRQYLTCCRQLKSQFSLEGVCLHRTGHVNDKDLYARSFSLSSKFHSSNKKPRVPMNLMDMSQVIRPVPWKWMERYYYEFRIKNEYGSSFSISGIVEGALQVLLYVSYYISKGWFSKVEELIEPKALKEIKEHYNKLDEWQRNFIAVSEHDIFRKFVAELTIRKDKDTGKEFAEALVVFHGYHGYLTVDFDGINPLKDIQDNPEQLFICNYKLVKELTKDLDKDWIIHGLNHFQKEDELFPLGR